MALILAGVNFYSIFYTTLFFTLCSGFVLTSSAADANNNLKFFLLGEKTVYKWRSAVFLNEIEGKTRNVGFSIIGKISASTVWESEDKTIIKFELDVLKLQADARIESSSDGFDFTSSKVNPHKNEPFVLLLNKGLAEKLFIAKDEPIYLKNIKKGIVSIFQFQPRDGTGSESDASGHCNVTYFSQKTKSSKTKSGCTFNEPNNFKHMDRILGANVLSTRETEYIADEENNLIKSVVSRENHRIFVHGKQELGSVVISEQILTYERSYSCNTIKVTSLEQALLQLIPGDTLELAEELLTQIETLPEKSEKRKFTKEVELVRERLKTEHFGTLKSAKAFLELLEIAKTSGSEDISKALNYKKNKIILSQLYDVLGYTQTKNSHSAVMKSLHLDSEEHTELIERYLWALSFSAHPNTEILEDLLNKYRKYPNIPDKIRDTLILSLASMARTLASTCLEPCLDYDRLKVLRSVEETIINGYDYAKNDDRYVFINALKNLQSPSTLPKLISIIQNGSLKEEVLAWRSIKSFGKLFWTKDLLKQAEKTVYSLDKMHDSSSRTLAADILLGAGITDDILVGLLNFIASNDSDFEIKQYVFQNVKMLSDKCEEFNRRVKNIIRKSSKLNNYSSQSPKGLSTALMRNIFSGTSANGSLVSVQEIHAGIVKRGVVDIILDKNDVSKELFTLNIFTGGLSSFVSSNSDEGKDEEETATAGMEITILGTQIRPFVFFVGSGELMGHVWSGTASEMTPAFQALILTQDHEEYLRLGNGFIVKIDLKGAISFDLSGKIEISIWNRNAQSLIEKSIGYILTGLVKVDTNFIKSQVEFEGAIEPKLKLEINTDFSNNIKMCMKLSQPDSVFRHKVAKFEAIPGSKHQLQYTLTRKQEVPGITYALNRKNSEMCNAIFS